MSSEMSRGEVCTLSLSGRRLGKEETGVRSSWKGLLPFLPSTIEFVVYLHL